MIGMEQQLTSSMEGTIRLMNALRPFDTNALNKTERFRASRGATGLEELAKVFKKKLKPYQYEEALRHYLPETELTKRAAKKQPINGKHLRNLPKVTSRPYEEQDRVLDARYEAAKQKSKGPQDCKYRVSKLNGATAMKKSRQLSEPRAKQLSGKDSLSYHSKQGHLITENQDTMVVDKSLFIICDGHGKNGKMVSDFVAKVLHQSCSFLFAEENHEAIHPKDYERLSKNIRQIFQETNEELRQEGIDVSMSGSTASLLYKDGDLIVVANCGDSQVFLCRQGVATELTKLHKPDMPGQRKRIEEQGGILKRISKAMKYAGPLRVYTTDGMVPGLAVSRSFGDTIGESCGVTCQPEISFYSRTPQDEFIVMGSDGLFEFFPADEVAKYCQQYIRDNRPIGQIAHSLVVEAATRWKTIEHDDITCIFVSLRQ